MKRSKDNQQSRERTKTRFKRERKVSGKRELASWPIIKQFKLEPSYNSTPTIAYVYPTQKTRKIVKYPEQEAKIVRLLSRKWILWVFARVCSTKVFIFSTWELHCSTCTRVLTAFSLRLCSLSGTNFLPKLRDPDSTPKMTTKPTITEAPITAKQCRSPYHKL